MSLMAQKTGRGVGTKKTPVASTLSGRTRGERRKFGGGQTTMSEGCGNKETKKFGDVRGYNITADV